MNAKNAAFFYKEHKRTKHSFIKKAKERKKVAFFLKERLPNPAKTRHCQQDGGKRTEKLWAPMGLRRKIVSAELGYLNKSTGLCRKLASYFCHATSHTCFSPVQMFNYKNTVYIRISGWFLASIFDCRIMYALCKAMLLRVVFDYGSSGFSVF